MGRTGTQLLERDDVIRGLLELLDGARRGAGSVAVLHGEAGIGKTSVVRAVVDAAGRSCRVLVGACEDFLAPAPLQPLRDAVRGTGGPLDRALGESRTANGYTAIVDELAEQRTTLLVIEDLHWADDSTLDHLRYLVRRLNQVNALVLLTYRDDEIWPRHRIRRLLGACAEVGAHRFRIEPLSAQAIAVLAAGSTWNSAELQQLTGGNPFFVSQTLAHPSGGVPGDVVDVVTARVRSMDTAAVAVVEQLSVLPAPTPVDRLQHLLGPSVDELVQAEHLGIIEVNGGFVRFRHDLARRAVEQSLGTLRRRNLNATVVQSLLDSDTDSHLSELVHHAVQAGDVACIMRYAPLAAAEASTAGSHRQALAHLEAVVPFADQLPLPEQISIYEAYSWQLHLARQTADAVAVGERALSLLEQLGDIERFADGLLRQAEYLRAVGQIASARTLSSRAGGLNESDYLTTAVATQQALLLVSEGDADAGLRSAEQACVLALNHGDSDIVGVALSTQGLARAVLGRSDTDFEGLHESLCFGKDTGNQCALYHSYVNLTESLYLSAQRAELSKITDEGAVYAADRGYELLSDHFALYRALLCLRTGDWTEAEANLRDLLACDSTSMVSLMVRSGLGRLLVRQGERQEAGALLSSAWEQAAPLGSIAPVAAVAAGYAEWAWLTGVTEVAQAISDNLAARPGFGVAAWFDEPLRYLRRSGVEEFAGPVIEQRGNPWAAAGDRYEQALDLMDSNEVDALVECHQLLGSLGATQTAAVARRKLKDLGARRIPRTAPSSKPKAHGLTSRQYDVLKLLAEGFTNAEIAERMVLSVRTVDHHVAAILNRWRVQSRHEAVARARSIKLLNATAESRLAELGTR